jgi:hypothetical protein
LEVGTYDTNFQPITQMYGWVSPRLKIRFELDGMELKLYRPDGTPFRSHTELNQVAEQQRQRAEQEFLRAEKLAAKLHELNIDPDTL